GEQAAFVHEGADGVSQQPGLDESAQHWLPHVIEFGVTGVTVDPPEPPVAPHAAPAPPVPPVPPLLLPHPITTERIATMAPRSLAISLMRDHRCNDNATRARDAIGGKPRAARVCLCQIPHVAGETLS